MMQEVFEDATPAEIDRTLDHASAAHRELKKLPRERRALLLERIAEEIEALGEELIELAGRETHLPPARLASERGRTTGQLRLFAEHVREDAWLDVRIDRALPERRPLPRPELRRIERALGPVVVFGAGNFPLAFSVAGGDTAAALAAGCPVVVKAHPHHPGTCELVARAIEKAVVATGMPAGTFALLHGRSEQVGRALVTHPATKAVAFTGSLRGGKALFDLAMARPEPIPVYAEMGSINPVFVLPRALEERGEEIAEGLAGSVTLGVGQFCTKPGLVLVVAGEASERFAQKLAERLAAVPPGTMLHAGVRRGYLAGLERWRGAEARALLDPAQAEGQARAALFCTGAASLRAHPELAEEVFGPATLLVECADATELEKAAQELRGQLTATVHAAGDDLASFEELVGILEEKAGRLVFGGFPTGVEVCAAMHHGGPFPATTDVRSTSVGTAAIRRFTRPVCYQGAPQEVLPVELRDGVE